MLTPTLPASFLVSCAQAAPAPPLRRIQRSGGRGVAARGRARRRGGVRRASLQEAASTVSSASASTPAATLLLRQETKGGALAMLTTPPPLLQVGVSSLAPRPGGTLTLGFSQQGGRERSTCRGHCSCGFWVLLVPAAFSIMSDLLEDTQPSPRQRWDGGLSAASLSGGRFHRRVSTFSCLWERQTWRNLNVVTFARFLGEGGVCRCCHDDGEQLTLKVVSLSRLPGNVLTVSKPEPSQVM